MTPPPSAPHVVTADGEAFIWLATSTVVVQKARGTLTMEMALLFSDFYDPLLQGDTRVTIFDDFEKVTLYARESREHLTALTLDRLEHVEAIHFLLGSKFLALGVGAFKQ
jgi:hypothetical protein